LLKPFIINLFFNFVLAPGSDLTLGRVHFQTGGFGTFSGRR
jgi:hypothetical protein